MSDRTVLTRWIPALLVVALTLTAAATTPAAPSRDDAAAKAPERLDVNSATEEQLQTVPGIGPALAKKIVAFREQNGPFESVEDLLKVRGIGERSLEKMRSHLTVSRRK